jgi:hypothetical protein
MPATTFERQEFDVRRRDPQWQLYVDSGRSIVWDEHRAAVELTCFRDGSSWRLVAPKEQWLRHLYM